MKRRSFLQYILGIFGISVTGLSKSKSADVIVANGTEPVQEWLSLTSGFMDFSPDEIVGIDNYRDRLFVYCKHSIWEIEENCYGDGLQRKLITNI